MLKVFENAKYAVNTTEKRIKPTIQLNINCTLGISKGNLTKVIIKYPIRAITQKTGTIAIDSFTKTENKVTGLKVRISRLFALMEDIPLLISVASRTAVGIASKKQANLLFARYKFAQMKTGTAYTMNLISA